MARKAAGPPRDGSNARAEILRAAQATILRFGFAKTTMDDIAKEAGISRPTVYRYFQDRTELVSALVDWRAREVLEDTHRYLSSAPASESFTDTFVRGVLHVVTTARQDPIVAIVLNRGNQQGESWSETLDLAFTLTKELWDPFFDDAQDAGRMRAGLDRVELYTWLTMVQFSLFNRMEFVAPEDPSHARMLRDYVMPALLPIAHARPAAPRRPRASAAKVS